MKYIVFLSGGKTSMWALKCTIEQKGKENTEVYFADTKGKKDTNNPHAGEDQDSYRYIHDIGKHFQIPIWRVADGRNIWDVMHDKRCITIPRQDYAPCSRSLKAEMLDEVVNAKYVPAEITRVFGMQWYEIARMEALRYVAHSACWFPLAEKPYIDDAQIDAWHIANDIALPRLYALGFEHNNCGGFCVRAGKAHFARLWFTMPDRYLYHEAKELELQEYLGKPVTVLRERRQGVSYRVSLREFRERLQAGDAKYDPNDFGACGCFLAGAQKVD